jgi:hypothetical protein
MSRSRRNYMIGLFVIAATILIAAFVPPSTPMPGFPRHTLQHGLCLLAVTWFGTLTIRWQMDRRQEKRHSK